MFQINLTSKVPIYEQLYRKIMELMVKGVLKEDDQLPSVRTLAKDLGINPNTVMKAYQELERNGIIYSIAGRGNFIAPMKDAVIYEKALSGFDQVVIDALKQGFSKEELIKRIEVLQYD